MVHIFGCIIPDPLHIPPSVTSVPSTKKRTAISLRCVSVVIIASAAVCPASNVSAFAAASNFIPSLIRSIGICIPITPVEPINTAFCGICNSSEAASASSLQYAIPCTPVPAFATPAFTTTACANGLFSTISLSHRTGAAFTTFVVNVPAAWHGVVLYISAISFLF